MGDIENNPNIPLTPPESPKEVTGNLPGTVGNTHEIKKNNNIFIVIFFILILIIISGLLFYMFKNSGKNKGGGANENTPVTTPTVFTTPAAVSLNTSIVESHNTFGLKVLKELAKNNNKNVVLSPASISLALSMVYNGSDKSTKEAMAKTLSLEGAELNEINNQNASLISFLNNPYPEVSLKVANSLWAKKGGEFNPLFLENMKKYYSAKTEYLDFSDPASANTINSWVNENTAEKIPTIVTPPLPTDLVMLLINAVYFKGTWTTEFDKNKTEKRDFTLPGGTQKEVQMMLQEKDDFEYYENEIFQAVSLPYGKNKKIRMLVFLPKKDLSDFMTKLNISEWKKWLTSLDQKKGKLYLPKFKITYEKELKDDLAKLGMAVAFDPAKADFSQLGKDLFISQVLHKTYIDVNEEGTEAAAVTSVGISVTSIGGNNNYFTMTVDKPYFFAIEESGTGEILFAGAVNDPQQ